MSKKLLEFKNLCTDFHTEGTIVKAVNDVSFVLNKGETIGIVGESVRDLYTIVELLNQP